MNDFVFAEPPPRGPRGGERAAHRCYCLVLAVFVLFAFSEERAVGKCSQPQSVVVWVSVDGLKSDYVDKADAPFLKRCVTEGAFTRQLAPVFPSLTFPAHVSQATGALVKDHGIIANAIYDLVHDRRWSYPHENRLILCEAIWTTAKRQGKRTLVFDWPVSHAQSGPHAADYFDQKFDPSLTDEQRIQRFLDTWMRDDHAEPLQLLMVYMGAVDKAGHEYGPNSPQTYKIVAEADRLLASTFQQCRQIVDQKVGEDVPLVFIVSTDHGMAEIHTLVHLAGLLGDRFTADMRSLTSGSVGNIFLEYIDDAEAKEVLAEGILEVLARHDFLEAYRRDVMPEEWGYNCPDRTGDVVVSLDPGYFFVNSPGPPIRPVDPVEGPIGMHGYPVSKSPEMYGFLGMMADGVATAGTDLGVVDSRRLHATVAKLLNINPAETALDEPLDLKASNE